METTVEKLKESKIKTTTTISDAEHADAEKKALERLASQVDIKGFRSGKAPLEKIRERINEEALLQETVRVLLPSVLKEGLAKSEAKPILRPAANVTSIKPLVISVTFVNRPPVTVKKPESIKVERKKVPDVTESDVDDFVEKVLLQDRTEALVERAAKAGDSIRISMKGTKKGKQVDELTVGSYAIMLGKEELFPELESHLTGMKKDEVKTVDVTFPKTHDIPGIRGEKIAVELTVKTVSEVTVPKLTQEYITQRLQTDKTPEALRSDIRLMIKDRRTSDEMKRREEELYDKVKEATSVEIASELIETEVQEMVRDLHERLKKQGTNLQDWLKNTGKDEKSIVEEMRTIAKSRTTLRFGLQELAEKLKIEPDEAEFKAAIASTEARAKAAGHTVPPEELLPEGSIYENLRYELRIKALLDRMVKDELSK